MRGGCCDALNPVARPSATRLRHLGVDFVRLVAFDEPVFYAYHTYLTAHHFKTAVVLTGSSFSTDDYRAESADYASKIEPSVWLLGNEFDIAGAASWPTSDEAFIDFWNHADPGIRSTQPESKLYVGGLFDAGSALDRLVRLIPRLVIPPTGADFHPYEASTAAIALLLSTARDSLGLETAVMEWNDSKPSEIDPFVRLLDDLTDYHAWIPWSTEQLNGELPGIVKRDRYTPVGRAYRSAIKETA